MPEKFNDTGQDRDKDDGKNHDGEILFDNRDISEEIAREYADPHPQHSANHIIA